MIFFSFIHFFSWLFLKLFLYFFSSHFFSIYPFDCNKMNDRFIGWWTSWPCFSFIFLLFVKMLASCKWVFFQKILLSPISIWHYPKVWLFDFDDDDDVNGLHLNIDHLYKKKNQSAIIFDGYMHMNFLFAHCRMHYH